MSGFDERAYREKHARKFARMTPAEAERAVAQRRAQIESGANMTREQMTECSRAARRAARSWVRFAGAGLVGRR